MKDNKTYAYIRVSTKEQNTDRQEIAINEYAKANNMNIDLMLTDKISGKNFDRPNYQLIKATIHKGDTLIIKELDRLGRNYDENKSEYEYWKNKGVNLIFIDNDYLNLKSDMTLEEKLMKDQMLQLLSYVAQKERESKNKICKEGINAMPKNEKGVRVSTKKGKEGRTYGRQNTPRPTNFEEVYKQWKSKEIKGVKAMELLGLKKTTFYKMVKEYEKENM